MADIRYKDLGAFFPLYREDAVRSDYSNWKHITINTPITDGGVAGTADVIGAAVAPHRLQIVAAYVTPMDNAITFHAVNYAQFDVDIVTPAGVIRTAATRNTAVDSLVQYIPAALTVAATPTSIVERGELIKVVLAKAAGGVACNQLMVTVVYKAVV